MRKIAFELSIVSAIALSGCGNSSSGGNAAPDPSGTPAGAVPSAAPAPSGPPAPSPSGAAKPEKEPKEAKEKEGEGPKDHKALVKALDEAWSSHDAKRIARLYTLEAVLHRPGAPDVKGRDAVEREAATSLAAFKDMSLVPGRAWAKDKKTIVVEWVARGTSTGDAPELGIPKATNRAFGVSVATWLTIAEDGLIEKERRYFDPVTLVGQVNGEKKVRAVLSAPPDGDKHYEASTRREERAAKDPKERAEIATMVKVEREEIELEDKGMAHVNAGKPEEIAKLVSKDYRHVDYTEEKDLKGEREFKELLRGWQRAFPDLRQRSTAMFADGEFAIEEIEYTGTQKGPYGSVKATNKPVTIHQLRVDEFKDGHFAKSWTWWNKGELLSELGSTPDPKKEK